MEDEEEFFSPLSFFSHFSVSAYSVKQQLFQLFVRQRDFYFILFDLFSGAVFYCGGGCFLSNLAPVTHWSDSWNPLVFPTCNSSPSLFESFPSLGCGTLRTLSSRVTACPCTGANKTLINDSGTFWSLIDRIGTTQRPSATTFIYLAGSLFQREDQTKKM